MHPMSACSLTTGLITAAFIDILPSPSRGASGFLAILLVVLGFGHFLGFVRGKCRNAGGLDQELSDTIPRDSNACPGRNLFDVFGPQQSRVCCRTTTVVTPKECDATKFITSWGLNDHPRVN